MGVNQKLASDCWRFIKALNLIAAVDQDGQVLMVDTTDVDASAERLIEMACDAAAEAQRSTAAAEP